MRSGCDVRSSNKIGKPYCFEVNVPTINKVFYIQGNSDAEVKQWIDAIVAGERVSTIGKF